MKETELKLHPCHCGGEMKIKKVAQNGGMDGTYYNWELTCSECGLTKTYAADNFYGRHYKTFEEVVDDWNKEREKSKTRNDLLVVKVKPGINVKADLMDHWRKEILRQKETGVVVLPWFLEAEVVPEDVEVQFIDPKSSCVLEEGFECQTSDQN